MLKVSANARRDYMELCPLSTHKCDDFAEMDYKIIRAVELGKLFSNNYGVKLYQYYHLMIMVINNEVISIKKSEKYCFKVSERLKKIHYNAYHKVLV